MLAFRRLPLASTLFVVLAASAPAAEKVTVCHVPPDDPTNARTIAIGAAALPAHLAHGDQESECGPVCVSNGGDCGSNEDCCSGVCGAEGLCAADCVEGPTDGYSGCNVALPCCEGFGLCLGGFCYPEDGTWTCEPHVGGYCDEFAGLPCCFDYFCNPDSHQCEAP